MNYNTHDGDVFWEKICMYALNARKSNLCL